MALPISLYLHIPFCKHRCAYCDFNTYSGLEDLIPKYVSALIREIESFAENANEVISIQTIFFGGGTPSLLAIQYVQRILESVGQNYALRDEVEISFEANPGSLSKEYLIDLHQSGINRLSMGVQSSNPNDLRILERQHNFLDVIRSMKWARVAGFENINLDLIFALPGQTLQSWQTSLERALELHPEHLSIYALSIEHGTPFRDMLRRGLFPLPDPDHAAEMYEWAQNRLATAGFDHYEISNWARRNPEGDILSCQHNLQYWRNLPYVGLGAGAHGWVGGIRTVNALSPAGYIQRMETEQKLSFPRTAATVSAEEISQQRAMAETMIMGLRLLNEGVSQKDFALRFGLSLNEVYSDQLEGLEAKNLLKRDGPNNDTLLLTTQAQLLGNQVFSEFV